MAATVAFLGTNLTEAESLTNWLKIGNVDNLSLDSDVEIQSTNCIASKATGTGDDGGMWYDYGTASGSSLDFSPAGSEEGQHLFI